MTGDRDLIEKLVWERDTAEELVTEARWLLENAPTPVLGGLMHTVHMEWVGRRDAWLAETRENQDA